MRPSRFLWVTVLLCVMGALPSASAPAQESYGTLAALDAECRRLHDAVTRSMVRVSVTHSAASILTPEQRIKFDESLSRQQREGPGGGSWGMGRGRGGMGGQGPGSTGAPVGGGRDVGGSGGGRGGGFGGRGSGSLIDQVQYFLQDERHLAEERSDRKAIAQIDFQLWRISLLRSAPFQGDIWAMLLDDKGNALLLAGLLREAHESATDSLKVRLPGGRDVAARYVGGNLAGGYSVIRLDKSDGLTPIAWAERGPVAGQLLLSLAASQGTVSLIMASGRTSDGEDRFTAPADDRNGAFLIDTRGALAAVVPWGGWPGERRGVAVPRISREIEFILKPGPDGRLGTDIEPRQFGIGFQQISDDRMSAGLRQMLGTRRGVQVISVDPRSPAEQSGLKPGDILLAINGRPISELVSAEGRALSSLTQMQLDLAIFTGEVPLVVIRRDGGRETERTLAMSLR